MIYETLPGFYLGGDEEDLKSLTKEENKTVDLELLNYRLNKYKESLNLADCSENLTEVKVLTIHGKFVIACHIN